MHFKQQLENENKDDPTKLKELQKKHGEERKLARRYIQGIEYDSEVINSF